MITRKQYKFLKKVSKNETQCDDLIESKDKIFKYLLNQNSSKNILYAQTTTFTRKTLSHIAEYPKTEKLNSRYTSRKTIVSGFRPYFP